MEKILFLLDSPCDLLEEQIKDLDIRIIPVTVTVGEETRLDYYEVDRVAFWKELAALPIPPVTAMAPLELWIEEFRKAKEDGYTHVIVAPVSSTSAGTLNAVTIARDLFNEDHSGGLVIEIVDLKSYSYVYGRIGLQGALMAKDGAPFAEIVEYMNEIAPRAQALLWVYSLLNLKKSGRISGMSAFVGETLGLRPILWIRGGLISPVERVRGDKNIVPKIIEMSKDYIVAPNEQDMVLMYSDVPEEEIARAEKMILDEIRPRSLKRHPIGAAIAINSGPQSMALLFTGKPVFEPSVATETTDATEATGAAEAAD